MEDPLVGARLDRYEVIRELGHGGMAVVYEARHCELGSRHALKVFAPGPGPLAERLLQEGRLQATLAHPHIVGVTDVISVEGRPALVLEFIDGVTLEAWVAAHPQADDAVRRRIACQIFAAVRHAHGQGTIHRDLKPANVLVAGTDEEPWAKVADFGLAKWLHATEAGRTRTGVPMGTPRYMAPEQIRDAKHVDERADVFALGCILAELWSGRPTFQGDNLPDIFMKIIGGEFEVPVEAPPDVAEAIRGALAVDPEQRLQSVDALAELVCGVPAPRPAIVPLAPARSAVPLAVAGLGGGVAALALVGVAGALALLLCLGVSWLAWPASDAPAEPIAEPAPAPAPIRRRGPRAAPVPVPAPAPAPAPPASPSPSPSPAPSPSPSPEPRPKPEGDDDDDDHKKDKDDDKEDKDKGKGGKGKGH